MAAVVAVAGDRTVDRGQGMGQYRTGDKTGDITEQGKGQDRTGDRTGDRRHGTEDRGQRAEDRTRNRTGQGIIS